MRRFAGLLVFLTPNGDSRRLFVGTMTANGFMVRESQGGHATLSFAYRVVATSLGQAGQRIAVAKIASPYASVPVVPKPALLPAPSP